MSERIVVEVTAVEALAPDEPGSRRALVRWRDGSADEALCRYDDEIPLLERDLIGKTEAQLSTLYFRRDRDSLRSDPSSGTSRPTGRRLYRSRLPG